MTRAKKNPNGVPPCPKCRSTFRALVEDNLLVCDDCGYTQKVRGSTLKRDPDEFDYDS